MFPTICSTQAKALLHPKLSRSYPPITALTRPKIRVHSNRRLELLDARLEQLVRSCAQVPRPFLVAPVAGQLPSEAQRQAPQSERLCIPGVPAGDQELCRVCPASRFFFVLLAKEAVGAVRWPQCQASARSFDSFAADGAGDTFSLQCA